MGVGVILVLVGFGLIDRSEMDRALLRWAYGANLVGMAAMVIGFGMAGTAKPLGFMLSGRNAYSLSKAQMAGWTIVILGSLLTAAEIRWAGNAGDALAIGLDGPLLAAMGIAAFTTAATPALLSLKDQAQVDKRGSDTEARLRDLVCGDEASNAGVVDLSKVQQLLITGMLLLGYVGLMLTEIGKLANEAAIKAAFSKLPSFSPEFIQLMALSHVGYLAYKAVPKPTPPAPPQ